MVKYIRKYADRKISSVYTKGIMEGIIVKFKKSKL